MEAKLEWTETELALLKTSCAQLSNDVRDLAEIHDFDRIKQLCQLTCQQAERDRDEAIRMLKVEESRRRSYLSQLLEIKGNIRVLCRIRPVNRIDETKQQSTVLSVVRTSRETVRCENREFEFDEVFPPTSTNANVFDEAMPMVESIFDGHHACIFAYGQTGSGKTHTMTGSKEDRGVNFRAVDLLFERKRQMLNTGLFAEVRFQISNVEIYNESVRDLLASSDSAAVTKELQIRQDLHKGVHLPDCTLVDADDIETIWCTMEMGQRNRAQALTKMNSESSRSHSIFMIDVYTRLAGNSGDNNNSGALMRGGKLILVDLAGSERPSKSEVSGERLKEAAAINKSLSVLGKVIAALGAKSAHVPFRDSKLTYLLQDSMGAQNKVMMIVQTAPTQFNAQESMCTLLFGSSARAVQLGRATAKNSGAAAAARVQQNEAMAEKYQLQQKLVAMERQLAEALARAERAEKLAKQNEGTLIKVEKDRDEALERLTQQCRIQPPPQQQQLPRRASIAAAATSRPSIIVQQQPLPRVMLSRQSTTTIAGVQTKQQQQLARSFGSQTERFPVRNSIAPPARLPVVRTRGDENRAQSSTTTVAAVTEDFAVRRLEKLTVTAPPSREVAAPDSPGHIPLPLPPPLSSSSSRSMQPPAPRSMLFSATPMSSAASTAAGSGRVMRRLIDHPQQQQLQQSHYAGTNGGRSLGLSSFGGGPSRVVNRRMPGGRG